MADSAFLKDVDYYQRRFNPIAQYIDQNSYYLSKMTGESKEVCKEYVTNGIKKKTFPDIRDPMVKFFERQDNLDTEIAEIPLSSYIATAVKENLIVAPTFTCYIPTKTFESLQVGFTDTNVKLRSIAKKASQKAEAAGDMLTYINKHNEQANKKMYNNSLSGAFVATGSVFKNPTAHNTLTSITRTVSSLGNATNEKIIMGSRHYRNPEVTLNNLISICSLTDMVELRECIEEFNLSYPSVQDTIDCVKWSTDVYWRDETAFQALTDFILVLDDVERAAIVYVSDLYHIRKYNDKFIRDLLTVFGTKVLGNHHEDAINKLYKFDEAIVNYAHQICLKEVRGMGKDYDKMPYEDVCTVLSTCYNIFDTVEKYRKFFNAIFLTRNMPCSTAYLPDMVRRSVVLSDTDSTMFSVDDYVEWYFGKLIFSDEAFAIAGAVVFITTQSISHVLAILSANLGVERKKIFNLAMKPEFVFPVFAQTSVAKHYYTLILVKEGNVYSKMKMEIKGVHLKNSASPPDLIKEAQANMESILKTVMSGEKISMIGELTRCANVERKITNSLVAGETTYFKKGKVKLPEAYANEDYARTPYVWHVFWLDVFAQKYGEVAKPPYSSLKFPTTLDNKTKLAEWVESIQDPIIKTKLSTWLTKHNKVNSLPTIYLPIQQVASFGLPQEVLGIINIKKILLDLTNINRIVLESLGYYPKKNMLITELGY